MTTFELLDFTEARELVKVGRLNEALPKLYRLAGSYPQDGEIQYLIRICLNVQSPPQSTPQPIYYVPAPPVPIVKNQTWIYALPGIGILTMLISVFLPWVTFGFGNAVTFYEFSFNGINTANGSPIVVNSLKPTDTAKFTANIHGWYLVAIIVVAVILILDGVLSTKIVFSLLLLITSLFAVGFMFWQHSEIEIFSANATANITAWYTSTLSNSVGSVKPGYGLIVGIVGALITFVGAIISSSVLDKKKYKP